ncbi:MAG TPA: phosphoglycerate mutase family protein [Gemmatimonadaceae bacterium]
MQLVVIRHAIAMEREEFAPTGRDDSLRPLTAKGEAKMKKASVGLRELVPEISVLAASPFTRAQQTAAIVGEAYDGLRVETTASLEPDSAMDDFIEWLRAQRGETVAVVGHEPHLGTLVTWLMTGIEESRVALKKGAAVLLEFPAVPTSGTGRLQWALTASQLGRMADH